MSMFYRKTEKINSEQVAEAKAQVCSGKGSREPIMGTFLFYYKCSETLFLALYLESCMF